MFTKNAINLLAGPSGFKQRAVNYLKELGYSDEDIIITYWEKQ